MTKLKLSEFLKLPIKPFIYGAFLSRIMSETINGQNYFFTYSDFRSSKYVHKDDFPLDQYSNEFINTLNKHSGHYNWEIKNASKTHLDARFYLANDITNMDESFLYKSLYQKLHQEDWLLTDNINEEKKSLFRGFMELRGSIDTTTKLISQDYFFNNSSEIKKAQFLVEQMNIPIYYANFNFRDLQPQYVSGENQRNPQFRIRLFYYAKEIGFLNKYKAEVFYNAYKRYIKNRILKDDITYFDVELPESRNDDVLLIKYLNFFTNNIYQKRLTSQAVEELRTRIGFTAKDFSDSNKRSRALVDLYNEISEDKCAVCGKTSTFDKLSGKQYFEIHHVISFHNDKKLDNIANLVKLCPDCHTMLKKDRATKEVQIKAIHSILHNHPEVCDFASSYLQIDDINELVEKIWRMLG